MKHTIFKIWPEDLSLSLVKIESDVAPDAPAVLVLPGGGYSVCADMEAEPVAETFAALGYHAWVLRYSTHTHGVNPHVHFPEPLRQVAAAMGHIRKACGNVPVVLMGFSAGGHLAACYANLWNDPVVEGQRPDVCVLGYAATDPSRSAMILKNILGQKESYSPEELRLCVPALLVGAQTPPSFLFHSVTDPMVPAQNSLDYAAALEKAGIAYELYLAGSGGHAYGVGTGLAAGAWVALADRFIKGVLTRPEDYDKDYVWEHASLRRAR